MKKLLFVLLISLVGFGLVFAGANPAEPPGAITAEAVSLTAEYGIHEDSVTQPAVLESALPTAEPSGFIVNMAFNTFAVKPESGAMNMIVIFIPAFKVKVNDENDFYLRC